MASELESLRARVAAIDIKGDALIALVRDLKAQLETMVNNATELAELKAGVTEAVAGLDDQLAEIEAELPPPPPLP